ncbi:hypothetical protein D6D12_06333 [Aureobasidium pullulans]|uniref:Ubiquitin-like domain-containing protein n=1 Tax=Aureobasidium pullulans TaxID=5580 RepID=A0A4S9DZX1_AURPU|nr:hypothetical protein D6D15_04199 [Aureobasidium pullulans]THX26280.1 hypothetical protein D6D12_06333 [Aureobasidium pullulans]
MSRGRGNFATYSSTGSHPIPHHLYDDGDAHYSHSDLDHNDHSSLYSTSASSESDIGPNDSASIPAARASSHARYQSHPHHHPHPQPPYPPSHDPPHIRKEASLRKSRPRRPPEHHHPPHPQPSRHAAYPEAVSTPSDPSELSASLASHYPYQGYSARASYHEPQWDEQQYHDPHYAQQNAHHTGPPTMMSGTSSGSYFSAGPAAMTPYEYGYGTPGYSYPGASAANPFVTAAPPLAPSPQPGHYYDQYGTHQMQRPDMVARTSMSYMPPEMQYGGYPPAPYPAMQAMMPRAYHYMHHPHTPSPVPEDKPTKAEKKEDPPPPAPAAPPPPTAEEIKKLEEEKARLQAESLINALKALQAEDKATADAANEKNKVVQAESDKIAALLADFEAKRLEREEAAAAKAAAEKAAAEAKAAREKELADAATAARETAEKEAATAAAIAKAENEKAIAEAKAAHEKSLAEAKAAADAAEAAKKAAEAERDANKPGPDADKAPIKFIDAVDRNFTLPWHLAKTWKGMEALIKQAFVNIEHIGPHVANGHYHLLGPNNEIILPQVWEVVVQPGWDIKMQLWPLPEIEKPMPGGFPPDLEPIVVGPQRVPPRNKGNKVSGTKSAGKRASIGPAPPPPPPAPIPQASPLPPHIHMPTVFAGHDDPNDPVVEFFTDDGGSGGRGGGGGGHKIKPSANSKPKKQGVPAFTKWMLGGTRPRPKGAEKLAAGGVKVRHVIVQK